MAPPNTAVEAEPLAVLVVRLSKAVWTAALASVKRADRLMASPFRSELSRSLHFGAEQLGSIRNRGWEMQATIGRGPFALAGMLSFVDSRVPSLAEAHAGDLREDDRMLGVPARSVSVPASWVTRTWSVSATTSRASDWIDYDYIALASPVAASADGLRSSWLRYPGNTHIDLTATRELARGCPCTWPSATCSTVRRASRTTSA